MSTVTALAARNADRVVCIGPGPAADSYLRDDLIVQAALGTRLRRDPSGLRIPVGEPRLARRAASHGLVFVGPPPAVIELAGDKLRARGSGGSAPACRCSPARSSGMARTPPQRHGEIGYPVLLKAAGGGGGRGIRLARDEGELEAQLNLARSEAGAAFGDRARVPRALSQAARHVEVQIAADEHGDVIHFGERDCSVQRRYQKLIEESPAPLLDPTVAARDQSRCGGVRSSDLLSQRGNRRVRARCLERRTSTSSR